MSPDTPDAENVPATAPAEPRRRTHRRVVRAGAEREQVAGVPEDERGGFGENDDRLLRDVPPHWGR